MAHFNIIAATTQAYQTSWAERRYLFRLAIVPFLIKTMGYLAGFSFGYQSNHIGLALFLLPAYFAEGWMLSHYTRLIVLGQRWPFRPTGDFEADIRVLKSRARGVMSGLLVFVLISMALSGIAALLITYLPSPADAAAGLPPVMGIGMIALLIFMIWAFRFMWLYIPYAVGGNARDYLKAVRGYMSSLPMIGVWMACVVPFMLVLQISNGLLQGLLGDSPLRDIASFLFVLLIVAFDTIKNLIVTAGITYGLLELFQKEGKVDLRT